MDLELEKKRRSLYKQMVAIRLCGGFLFSYGLLDAMANINTLEKQSQIIFLIESLEFLLPMAIGLMMLTIKPIQEIRIEPIQETRIDLFPRRGK
ncbi:hypothetical protein HY991_01030 [Candidatus Micrarchaeota archaeon]|nr:hypothetical protein [Candidatus Micrarchaeota archaeon]